VSETRKLAAILVADIVGYSRLTGADEDRILARLRTLRSDLIDPTIAVHHGHIVKRTGDGAIIEFRSVVDAVRCAVEVQSGHPSKPLEQMVSDFLQRGGSARGCGKRTHPRCSHRRRARWTS
jgi:class 3 adenylate cyclase